MLCLHMSPKQVSCLKRVKGFVHVSVLKFIVVLGIRRCMGAPLFFCLFYKGEQIL